MKASVDLALSRKSPAVVLAKFPNLVADDTYVAFIKSEERETLSSVRSIVFAPHTIKDLIAIEARADFGTFELGCQYPELVANKGESIRLQPFPRCFLA